MASALNSFALFEDEAAEEITLVFANVAKKRAEEARRKAEEEEEARRQAELERRQAEATFLLVKESGENSTQIQKHVNGRGESGSGRGQSRSGRNVGFKNDNCWSNNSYHIKGASNGGYLGRGGNSSGNGGRGQGQSKSNGFKTKIQVEAKEKPQNEDQEEKVCKSVTNDCPYVEEKRNNGNRGDGWYNTGRGRSSFGSYHGGRNIGSVNWKPKSGEKHPLGDSARVFGDATSGSATESTELSKDVANDTARENVKVADETEEQRNVREKEEREKKSARSEQERTEIEKEAKRKAWLDAKRMTLKQYEDAILAEKRKALKDKVKQLDERKITLDKSFQTMSLVERKDEGSLLVKLESKTEKSKRREKNTKVQKMSITEFMKKGEVNLSEGKSVEGEDRKQPSEGEFKNNGHGGGAHGRGAFFRQTAYSANGEATRMDSGFNRQTYNSNGNNRGGRGGYPKATSNAPVSKSYHCNESGPVKTPPPMDDAEQFPDLIKALRA